MVQVLEGCVNLLDLDVEEVEIEKVIDLWKPQSQDSIFSIKDSRIVSLQSVNNHTEFVEVRVNEIDRSVISFEQLKEEYVPVLTFSQAKLLVEELPPEFEGLKEKIIEFIS
jgi:hypothetical protein